MRKRVLITAAAMEIGGVERSLAAMLAEFDYDKYEVDLLLFSQTGELLDSIPVNCNILPENKALAALHKPIKDALFSGIWTVAGARLFSKAEAAIKKRINKTTEHMEPGTDLSQAYWDNSISFLPELKTKYDAAISYIWPHHYVACKVCADVKIAWVHTDYSRVNVNKEKDLKIWNRFSAIAAVSDSCAEVFTEIYPSLKKKTFTVENILSADFVKSQAEQFVPQEMGGSCVKLLTVGRFSYSKAFDFAAEICAELVKKGYGIRWYAVGYGSEEGHIRTKIKELGLEDYFIVLGKKTNPYPYFKACDIYVQPSRFEGKAVTVREAQILGKPVVITDFKTARSQVRDGFDAIIAPPDKDSVCRAIISLIEDSRLRERLSENAGKTDCTNMDSMEILYGLLDSGKE